MKTVREFLEENNELRLMWSKNNSDTLLDLKINSSKKALWVCEKFGAEYAKPISVKIQKPESCSVCTGSTVFSGYNDLKTLYPNLASEWDYEKNDISPEQVKYSTGKKFYWKCSNGHKWETRVSHRTSSGSGCPQCQKENKADLQRIRSMEKYGIVSEGNDEMARYYVGDSEKVPARNSHKPCKWKCDSGHSWEQPPRAFNGCPYCLKRRTLSGEVINSQKETISAIPEMSKLYHEDNKLKADEVSSSSAKKSLWKCSENHIWEAYPYAIKKSLAKGNKCCPYCVNQVSSQEKRIREVVKKALPNAEIRYNDRKVIAPYELDIYIPSLSIAIEYNGLYWHSESRTNYDKHYHYNKWKMCDKRGIQLITVWEDDWAEKESIITKTIKHKLKNSSQDRVYARKTVVQEINSRTAEKFCNDNHIQGYTSGSKYYALYDEDEIVAVSIWRKNKNILYLDRYCTSKTVVGGMGKLLQAGKRYALDSELTKIVTFSDHSISDGGLYEKLGFVKELELPPDYSYVIRKKRVHKFNYRKKRFKEDPLLLWEEGLTESELASLNKIDRVWDSGKTRWIINLV